MEAITATEGVALVEESEVTGKGPMLVVVEVVDYGPEASDRWNVLVVHHYPVDREGATECEVAHRLSAADDAGLLQMVKMAQVLAERDREAYRQAGRWTAGV